MRVFPLVRTNYFLFLNYIDTWRPPLFNEVYVISSFFQENMFFFFFFLNLLKVVTFWSFFLILSPVPTDKRGLRSPVTPLPPLIKRVSWFLSNNCLPNGWVSFLIETPRLYFLRLHNWVSMTVSFLHWNSYTKSLEFPINVVPSNSASPPQRDSHPHPLLFHRFKTLENNFEQKEQT